MATLAVRLLGPPIAELDGVPMEVDTRKATALLAYLAMTDRPHGRDPLAGLLWPDYDQASARAALRRTLSTLRKGLAGGWLVTRGDLIELERAGLELDTEQFRSLVQRSAEHEHPSPAVCDECLKTLGEALVLYRDDFMYGFSLRDSADFDDWRSLEAGALRREFSDALDRVTGGQIARGDLAAAIRSAQRRLALDPLHEPAHRTLMLLLAWTGERSAALRQYRDCVRILDEELGVSPLEETSQLYHAIVEDHVPEPPRDAVRDEARQPAERDTETPAHAGAPALVGRDAEWQAVRSAYNGIEGTGHLIAIEGEAGIGKTRLVEELTKHASAQGALTLTARSYEAESVLVYSVFVQLLRAALASQRGQVVTAELSTQAISELARLLPELRERRPDAPDPVPLDSAGAQGRLFDAVVEALARVCDGGPAALLVVEDLHWADEASIELLSYLAHRLTGRPICLAATWRSETTAAGGVLRRLVHEGQREGWATLVSLQRLSIEAVAQLVEASVPDAFNMEGVAGRLYEESEGVPFFVVEYLAALARQRDAGDESVWSLPGGVRELLHSRVATISEAGQQVLTAAGVIGRSFEFDVLREASGRSEEEAVSALEELLREGIVTELGAEAGELAYDFSHEKLRTLVYEETSLARRRLLHRRVAGALARHTRGRDRGLVAGQIALHYRQAGQDEAAAEHYRIAGEHARSLYANAEAMAHFEAALALGHGRAAELHEAIGDLHTLAGRYHEALQSYETAAALGDAGRLAVLEHKLAALHHRRGEWELAERHFAAALEELQKLEQQGASARLYADWSLTAYQQDDLARAVDLAEQGLALAEQTDDAAALTQAHNILGILAGARGERDGAIGHLEQSLALAEEVADTSARIAAMNNLALACAAQGDVARAIDLTQGALEACVQVGDRHREAALHNNLADALHAAGRTDEAMEHLKQAVAIFAEIGPEDGPAPPEIWKLTEW
jgi:DNA-binding SARP family transcriptional activator/tetratricopeptide (TPR) repeat protein